MNRYRVQSPFQDSYLEIDREPPLSIIFADKSLIAVNKPAGQLFHGYTQGHPSTLVDQAKHSIREMTGKTGEVYLAVVHRLDRPVSGLAVFGRNSKAGSRLSQQFQERSVQKNYLAIVEGHLDRKNGILEDELPRLGEGKEGSALCRLSYEMIAEDEACSLVSIQLGTGRRHQIRMQFARRGRPLLGDSEYGSRFPIPGAPDDKRFAPIALHALSLELKHPLSYETMKLKAALPFYWSALPLNQAARDFYARLEAVGGPEH